MFLSTGTVLRSLTPEDIARVAQRYLKASIWTVGRLHAVGDSAGSCGVKVPARTPERSLAMLNNYAGRAAVAQGEAFF